MRIVSRDEALVNRGSVTGRRWRILLGVASAVILTVAMSLQHWSPATVEARYLLPWSAGEAFRHSVIQGNFLADNLTGACVSGCSTHEDQDSHFALDFDLPDGTEVLAARGGTVGLVVGSWSPRHCGGLAPIADPPAGFLVDPLMGNQANLVRIDHGDGTSALYLHLSSVSADIERKVKTGQPVAQGEVLGISGRTGLTLCQPHLHFQVETTVRADWFTTSLPVRFSDGDVASRTPDSVPVEGESYVSDNVRVGATG